MKRLGRRGVAVACVVVVAIAVGGIAYASIPDSNGVIHGCYVKTTGKLRVIDSAGNECLSSEKPLSWSQGLSSAYLDASSSANSPQIVPAGNAASFDTVLNVSGITVGIGGTDFTVAAGGVYQVTVALQTGSLIRAQLTVNGVGVGPSLLLDSFNTTSTFTRLLSVNAGDTIRLVNISESPGNVGPKSGITIVRIA
jgi:hypothetical protein